MRRLFIADVHGNLPAFEAVLRDAGDVDEILFLGDIVHGPHPTQCIDLMLEIGARWIAGNHDLQLLPPTKPRLARLDRVNWPEWSREQVSEEHVAHVSRLPLEMLIPSASGQIRLIHHPRDAPYLHPAMPDEVLGYHFRAELGAVIFFGHSHRAMDRTVAGRRLVCIPSVGQPRDGDPRAGYALEVEGEPCFRRVAYDVEQTVADMRSISFEPGITERWVQFLRTGYDPEWSREYEPE